MDQRKLFEYFQGKQSASQRHAIRQWVEASPENYTEFMTARKLFDASLLLAPESAERKTARRRWLRWISATASIAAALAVGAFSMHFIDNRKEAGIQQVIVPEGQRVNLMLADGSEVWLNSGSRFSYSTEFSKRERTVELEGEGYFKVAKDKDHPFTVHTSQAELEVLGTEFNLIADEHNFTASLVNGSVRLTAEEEVTVLKPNEKAVLSDGRFVVSNDIDQEEFLWRDGILSYKETSFPELMKKFEEFYQVTIRIEKPGLENYFSVGKFRKEDGIGHALSVLASDADFSYEILTDQHLIIIK